MKPSRAIPAYRGSRDRFRFCISRGLVFVFSLSLCLGQSVTLTWDPNPELDLLGYHLYRSAQSGTGYARINAEPITGTRYTDSGLEPGVTYFYVCTALNRAGLESGYSNQVSFTVPFPVPPPEPEPPPAPVPPVEDPAPQPGISAKEIPPTYPDRVAVPHRLDSAGDRFRDLFVGVGMIGSEQEEVRVRVSARDAAGRILAWFPADFELGAGAQRALLTSDLSAPLDSLWLEFAGVADGMLMAGDFAGRSLDGVAMGRRDRELYFPRSERRDEESGLLVISNPSADVTAHFTLEMLDSRGSVRAVHARILYPGRSLLEDLAALSAVGESGSPRYLRLRSDHPVSAYGLLATEQSVTGAVARPAEEVSELWAPHYFVDGAAGTSVLTLLSADTTGSSTVEVRILDDAGEVWGSRELELPRQGMARVDLSELVDDLDPGGILTGLLQVRVLHGTRRLAGWLQLQGGGGRTATMLPLSARGVRELRFAQVAQAEDDSIFTGLVILNPGTEPAWTRIEARDSQGRLHRQRSFAVEAGVRVVGLLRSAELFGVDFTQRGGHLRLTADRPVIAFAIFGDAAGHFLSAVEGQEP